MYKYHAISLDLDSITPNLLPHTNIKSTTAHSLILQTTIATIFQLKSKIFNSKIQQHFTSHESEIAVMAEEKTTKKRGRGSRRGSRRPSHSDPDYEDSRSRSVKRARIDSAQQNGEDNAPATGNTSSRPRRPRRTIRRPSRYDETPTVQSQTRRRRRARPSSATAAPSATTAPSLSRQTTSPELSGTTIVNNNDGPESESEQGDVPYLPRIATPDPNTDARCDQNIDHFFASTEPCVGPHPVPYFVCHICIDRQGHNLAPVERDAVESHKVPICRGCATAETQRRANRQYRLCRCLEQVRNGTRCDPCRITAMNEVRVAARERRDTSIRQGWREWLCAECGTQLQGQRGGRACLACSGIDLERGPTTSILAPPAPTISHGATLNTSQYPEPSTGGWLLGASTVNHDATFNTTQYPQGNGNAWPMNSLGPTTAMGAPESFTNQPPEVSIGTWLDPALATFPQGITPAETTGTTMPIMSTDQTSQDPGDVSSNWLALPFMGMGFGDQYPFEGNGNSGGNGS